MAVTLASSAAFAAGEKQAGGVQCPWRKSTANAIEATCQWIHETPQVREACQEIPEKNRLRCDGTESAGLLQGKWDTLRGCVPGIVRGGIETVKDAVDLGVWAAQAVGNTVSWAFGSRSARAETASEKTEAGKSQADSSSGKGAPAVADEEPSGTLSDDVGNYAVHTALDKNELKEMALYLADFSYFFLEDLAMSARDGLFEFTCLNQRAKAEAMCAFITNLAIPFKAFLKVASLAKKGVKAASIRKQIGPSQFDRATQAARAKMRGK